MNNSPKGRTVSFSVCFLLMAILFNVCLIASNLFETKLFVLGAISLTGGVVIFPVSYILNDCIVEVWGYKKARLVIWTGFAMNFFVVLTAQLVRLRPFRLCIRPGPTHHPCFYACLCERLERQCLGNEQDEGSQFRQAFLAQGHSLYHSGGDHRFPDFLPYRILGPRSRQYA